MKRPGLPYGTTSSKWPDFSPTDTWNAGLAKVKGGEVGEM